MRFLITLPYYYYFLAVLVFMLGWWLTMRMRRSAGIWRLRYYAMPRKWLLHLHKFVPYYRRVPIELRAMYQDKVLQFVDGKTFRCADPMLLVEEDTRMTLAGTACMLLLNDNGDGSFPDILAVQLWPLGTTMETVESSARPVKCISLNWDPVKHQATDPRDAGNPALPGIAKALGWESAGRSQLPEVLLLSPWARQRSGQFTAKFPGVLDSFEGDSDDVFAIATEMFYAAPDLLQKKHAKLYSAMRHFYCIDPARWKSKA